MTASKLKASDKADLVKKLTTALKKRYKSSAPSESRPVLEMLLYAVCLEDVTHAEAEKTLSGLLATFHEDLNEIRVSPISELTVALQKTTMPEWRALRARSALQHIFEEVYEYKYDDLKKKTLEQATDTLQKIPNLTSFNRLYVLLHACGGHVIPLDRSSLAVMAWLGIVEPGMSAEDASASLKPAIRKADVPEFVHLLREVATEAKFRPVFAEALEPADPDDEEEGEDDADRFDSSTGMKRLKDLFDGKIKPTKKKAAAKSTSKKTSKKSTTKKPAAKKTASKKSTAKKPATKKSTAKKSTAKKATAKKSAAKKTAKKTTTTSKKSTPRKKTARKSN